MSWGNWDFMGPNASKRLPLTPADLNFHNGIACLVLLLCGYLQHGTTFHLPLAKNTVVVHLLLVQRS